MKRREFISLVGGATVWSLGDLSCQSSALPVIGILNGGAPREYTQFIEVFRLALKESGFVEGRSVTIEYYSAEGRYDRLPALASALADRKVAVIFAIGGGASALAAKAASSTIPVVFANGSDPIRLGLIASIHEPGGNVTGITWFGSDLEGKRIELVRDLLPNVTVIGFLVNGANPSAEVQVANAQAAAAMIGRKVEILSARSEMEITDSFAKIARERIGALAIALDPFLLNRRDQLLELTSTYMVPTIYGLREYTVAGGLLSYGNNLSEGYRLAGQYVARVLAGATPRDMPVAQATRFELVINLKTAKTLGITVPSTLLARADEVIE